MFALNSFIKICLMSRYIFITNFNNIAMVNINSNKKIIVTDIIILSK